MRSISLSVLAVIFSISVSAKGIKFIEGKSWKEVLALAKKENKLIFLDAYASWCGPCKYLQKNVFTDETVAGYYNATFINVKMDMEEGEGIALSELYNVTSYPTLFFINAEGKLVHKAIGAMAPDEFLLLGKDATNASTQYFTVKELARKGKLEPKAFHDWIHTANKMEDDDIGDVLNAYFKASTYPLMDKEMLSIIFDHPVLLSKSQIDQLFKQSVTVINKIFITREQFDAVLLKKITAYSTEQSVTGDHMDFVKFRNIVNAYYPEKGLLETQKRKVFYYKEKEQHSKCLSELAALIDNREFGIPLSDLAGMVIDATDIIVAEKKGVEFTQKIKDHALSPDDKETEYLKDFILLFLYFRMEDQAGIKLYSDKLIKDEKTPQHVLDLVKAILEE